MKQKNNEEEDFVPKAFQKKEVEKQEKTSSNKKINKNKNKHQKQIKPKKKIKRIVITILLVIIIILGISLGISSHRWKSLAQQMIINENSIVLDIDNNEIAKIGSEKKQKTISLANMPENLKNAYVAIEDERYYSHLGIDIKRTGAAILSYITHFGSSSYGGSTITQQLVKNLTGDSSDSIIRKVKEWWKAWQLETCLSKEEILEAYLNIIYVGPNTYGVEAGSKYYFNKSSKELTLEECAFLAGINHSPNSYNPFEGKNNHEKITKRTKIVLNKMKELEYINEEQCAEAVQKTEKGLKFKEGTTTSGNGVFSYHTDALINEITEDISEKYNISKTFATNYLNTAGLTIYSTQDSKIQKQTETEFEKSKYSLPSKIGGNSSQAAMVIMNHKNGEVVACTGGLGKKKTARSLNRATQSVRQTGSAIKPIAVLAPAIDKKIITASSIYDDTERDFKDGYHPVDYSKPLGEITVRRAVESSQNIPFVEIMEKIKPKNAISYLEKMGVTSLTKEDNNLALSLGGLQKGISPLEMAGAYSTIANNGQYIEPTFYSKITDKSNNIVVKAKQKKTKVFPKEVACILQQILTQPVKGTYGTATYCNISGVDVAAKTGTTDENYDRWLCGFTPYYTAVTWYGYDQNETIEYNKKNPAGLLWANVMSRIHTGLQSAKFDIPNTVSTITICAESGKKGKSGCPHTYQEYFLWLTVPESCTKHSGTDIEYKSNTTNNNQTNTNKPNKIIQGITEDIDAVDPQQMLPTNPSKENETTEKPKETNSVSRKYKYY